MPSTDYALIVLYDYYRKKNIYSFLMKSTFCPLLRKLSLSLAMLAQHFYHIKLCHPYEIS